MGLLLRPHPVIVPEHVDIASLVGILTRVEVRTNIYDLKVLTLTVFDPLWITHVVWRLSSWSSRVWRHYFKLQFAWRCHTLTFAVQEHHMSSVRDNTTQQVSVEMTRNGASMSNHVNYDFMTIPIIRYPCCSDQPTSAWSNLDSSNQPEQSSQLDAQTHQIYTFSRNGRRRNFSARRDWIGLTSCQTLCDFRPDLLRGRSLPRIPRLWASNRQRIRFSLWSACSTITAKLFDLSTHVKLTLKTIHVIDVEDSNELEPNHNDQ